ncbi:hypothetical protein D6745_03425 [Candidatus Woesearchaeota archaeon]|nr:MAG: hypothetical protein D6745_03425 [Candidatus Woesearchaeota archaeon]
MRKTKKRGFIWINWILIVAFTITLGTFVAKWLIGFTKERTSEFQERTMNPSFCQDTGVSLDEICQNPQTLNIKVTNRKELEVSKLLFRVFDIYGNPATREKNVSLYPGDVERLVILKQGTTKKVEIIPFTKKNLKNIMCSESSVTAVNISYC